MVAEGFVSGGANALPARYAAAFKARRAGEAARARRLVYDEIYPIVDALTALPGVPAAKYLATLAGLDIGEPFSPLSPLTEAEKRTLKERVEDVLKPVA